MIGCEVVICIKFYKAKQKEKKKKKNEDRKRIKLEDREGETAAYGCLGNKSAAGLLIPNITAGCE